MTTKTDTCKCGDSKDPRAVRCRKCIDLEKAAQPCKGCGKLEPEVKFRKRFYKCTRDGRGWKRNSRCRDCERRMAKEWRIANPEENKRRKRQWEKDNPEKYHRGVRRRGWRKLGLNPDYVEQIFNNHSGLCEICGELPELYKELSADHCHTTNKFRGFLCYKCNLAVGQFRDRVDLLKKAIDYLNKSNQGFCDIPDPSRM